MALPVTIAADTSLRNSYHGPFKSSEGAYYTILEDATPDGNIEAWKATDPTDAFTEQDSGTRPNFVAAALSLNVFQFGDKLHVAAQNSSDDVYYARFDMKDDVWDTPDATNEEELIDGAPDSLFDACDICVLSTGKIRVVYQGAVDMDMGGSFGRIDESNSTDGGANWNGPNKIDNSDATDAQGINYTAPRIVLPPNNADQCHVFCKGFTEANALNLAQVAIASDNTIRTVRDTSFVIVNNSYPITHGLGFIRAGTSKVRIGYHESSTSDLEVLEFDAFSGDTDRTETSSKVSTENMFTNTVSSIVACLALDGSTIRGLMAKIISQNVHEFDDGGSDTYTLQGTAHLQGDANHLSCNVYDRDGDTKLAMIYDDGGTIKYDEISIAAIDRATLASVDMATLNLFHGPFDI